MGAIRKVKFPVTLSISVTSAWFVTPVIVFILLLSDTGFCSDSDSRQLEELLKLARVTSAVNQETRQTGLSSIDIKGAADTDSETSESQPSAFDLVAEWANNNEPLDSSNPVVSSIASLLSGLGRGSQHDDEDSHGDNYEHEHDHEHDHDHSSNDLQAEGTISHISHLFHGSPSPPHYLKTGVHVVEEPKWSFWDWLHSDGTYVAVVLILFGVIPILIGLLPYFLIASNFWFIFSKIHSLHAAFLELLHNPLDGYDSHHVGYDYGGGGGWEATEGWRHYRG